MSRDELRASDADREHTADRLRQALSEGRLDLHEYDERLQRAYAAKTYGDLKGVVADLPDSLPLQLVGVPQQASAVAVPSATRQWLWQLWQGYFNVVSVVVGIYLVSALATGAFLYPWPFWVAGPWGLVLLGQTVSGLAKGEPQRWVEKKERKRQEKIAKRERKAAELPPGDTPRLEERNHEV
jgi:hypothetical protein